MNKRWSALIALTIVAFVTDAEQRCLGSELQGIALSTHDPKERRAAFLKWLQSNGKYCSEEKILLIQNRRAEWLGNSDSTEIQMVINLLLEK